MKEESFFLDDRAIDNYLFTHLVELGYAPTLEEIQDITDVFFMLLSDVGVISEEEQGEGRENWK
jgi:hypothetical protein